MEHFIRLGKMIFYMAGLGLLLGAIAGFLGVVTIFVLNILGSSPSEIFSWVGGLILSGFLYGCTFGGGYGGVSGLASGIMMALVTAVGFGEVRNVQVYRLTMGVVTLVMTSGVFILSGLWRYVNSMGLEWIAMVAMSVVIAVYASQIVSKQYIKEVGLFKKKKGVA